MNIHSHRSPGSIVSGPGSVTSTGEVLRELGVRNAVVICDEGIKKAGLHESAVASISASDIGVRVLATAEPEPSATSVEEVALAVRSHGCDSVVGIGGGSSLDTAKLAAILAVNPGRVADCLGIGIIPKPGLPTVMIPTTSGTGSEMTPNAIVSLPEEGRKAGAVSPFLVPHAAILDPELTLDLPRSITASTGLDALIHCLESYIGKKANTLSDGFALQGLRLISGALTNAYHHGNDVKARYDMLIGSSYGGMSLTASGTAAVHALAYAIGAKYHIPHGVANSMLLVPVLERSLEACESRLASAASAMGLKPTAKIALSYLKELSIELEIPSTLDSFGYREADLDELVSSAMKVTRLLDNNPKQFTAQDVRDVFVAVGGT